MQRASSWFPSRLAGGLASQLHPRRLVPGVLTGLIVGLLQVFLAVSLAALVFTGQLSPFLARGVGFALMSVLVVGALVALFSSLPGTIGGTQDVSAAITAVIAADIAVALGAGASAEARFATVMVAVALTTVTTGLFLLLLGHFRLGNLVRFLPYPVVGGFLAGTGWLLVTGALGLMAGVSPELRDPLPLFAPAVVAQWAPGLLFALVLLAAGIRLRHPLALPGLVLCALALFYAGALAAGASLPELLSRGWLLGPFPEGGLWQPLTWAELRLAEAAPVLAQLPGIATVGLVSVVAVLLNAGGLEVASRSEVDLNRELRVAGLGNLAAGAAGSLVGFQQLSMSILGLRLGSRGRLGGVLAAGLAGITLLAGAEFLSLVPKPVLGGLIMFLGLAFLKEWVVDARHRLPPLEYAVVLAILAVIAVAGFLEGVAVGLVAAVLLFVVTYSRTEVVRHELTGAELSSRVSRDPALRGILGPRASGIHVLQLQGFVFFGTADKLLRRVRERLESPVEPALEFLLLDFRRVSGLDSTAALSFVKLQQLAAARGVALVLTGLRPSMREQLVRSGIEPGGAVRYLADLDQGLEWCEDEQLRRAAAAAAPSSLEARLAALSPGESLWPMLLPYLTPVRLGPGTRLLEQGAEADALYFVESGRLTVQVERPGEEPVRLETMGAGQVLGELGFLLGERRAASVVVDEACVVYRLTRDALARMRLHDAAAALALHGLLAQLLASRVRHLMGVVQALER